MISLLLLAVSPTLAASPTGGAYGGLYVMGATQPMNTAPTAVGRVGLTLAPPVDLEADFGWAQSTTRAHGYVYELLDPRLNVLVHFTPAQRVDVFAVAGGGAEHITVNRDNAAGQAKDDSTLLYRNPQTDLLVNGGIGLTVQLVGALHLRTDVRWMGTFFGDASASHGPLYGDALEWTLGVDLRAEEPPDRDGDGLLNRDDRCPDDAEDVDGYQDADGCPEADNDKDGLPDSRDTCPDKAEDKDRFEDGDGCPDQDNDRDDVLDTQDACLNEPEDADAFEDDDGCPELDNDHDGLADDTDRCPDEPETVNAYQDADGCPDAVPVEVARFTGVIQGITFDNNKATIRASSEPTLQGALATLLQFPDMRIEIQGHTDDKAADAYNLDLSQRRADAVLAWFVSHGVDAARLRAVGYGETVPVADNTTDLGRATNRRVEFKLIQ